MSKGSLAKKKQNNGFFYTFGTVFLLWYLFDLGMKVYLYDGFDFLWFCSFALLYFAIGLLLKNPYILLSGFAIIFLFHIDWAIDFIWNTIFNHSLTGSVSYVFYRGNRIIEFINSLRHLFMLPLVWYALVKLNKYPKRGWIVIPFLIGIAHLLTYLLTSPSDNINCAFQPCWPALEMPFFWQYLFFGSFVFYIIPVIIYIISQRLFTRIKRPSSPTYLRILIIWLAVVLIVGSTGFVKFFTQPRYICDFFPTINDRGVSTKCVYVNEKNQAITVSFKVENFEEVNKTCLSDLYAGREFIERREFNLRGKTAIYLKFKIPPPKEKQRLYLRLSCT
jgi:preprotein translocase subunit Sss1